jgi:hypothetical protein
MTLSNSGVSYGLGMPKLQGKMYNALFVEEMVNMNHQHILQHKP